MSLSIKNLSQVLGKKRILKNINCQFRSGEVSVISGPNGSGKTTLIKSIMNLYHIEHKTVLLNCVDSKTLSVKERAKKIGYVPQFSRTDFDYSVQEIVQMGRYPYSSPLDFKNDSGVIDNVMELTSITNLSNRKISTLSGGEFQRVLLARALSVEPDFLILDEPYSNLDISHNLEMMKLIKDITYKFNITTVMVLHDLPSIYKFSDYTILMKDGEVAYEGDTKKVIKKESIKDIFNIDISFLKDDQGTTHIVY